MAAEVKLRESAGGVVEEGRKWGGGMLDLVKKGVDLGKLSEFELRSPSFVSFRLFLPGLGRSRQ